MLTMLRNILCDGYGDRQHCRLSTFTFFLDTESETNPNNNLMMRRAGLSSLTMLILSVNALQSAFANAPSIILYPCCF